MSYTSVFFLEGSLEFGFFKLGLFPSLCINYIRKTDKTQDKTLQLIKPRKTQIKSKSQKLNFGLLISFSLVYVLSLYIVSYDIKLV